jgi:hypothetical protein
MQTTLVNPPRRPLLRLRRAFLSQTARLSEMDVDVDQARDDDEAVQSIAEG